MEQTGRPLPQRNAELRRYRRHETTRFAWLKTIVPRGATPVEGIGYCTDVARGGCGIVTDTKLEVDDLLMVTIAFDRQHFVLSAACRVVFAKQRSDGSLQVGLEFAVLPPDAHGFLGRYFP